MTMCVERKCARQRLKAVVSGTVLILCAALDVTPFAAYAGAAGANAYTYDGLGRVRSVTYSNGSTVSYTYDQAGNRTQVVRFNNNHDPVANPDSASTGYNAPVTLDPRGNDTDPDGNALTVTAVGAPGHGSATYTATSVTYTPAAGFFGSDSFTYTISDGRGGSATATVTVAVATPPAPVANNASIATGYNTAGSTGLSIGGVYGSTALATGAAHGTASVSGATASYTPNSGYYGADSFTYTATGPGGTSAPATVSVNVATPAAPSVANAAINTAYNATGSTSLSVSGVYSATALVTGASHGTASISGTTASYTPNSGYYGSDSFTYRASGPGGDSAVATVSVNVATPAAPSVGNVSLSTAYNAAGSTSLSISGVYSATALVTGASHGTASISGTTASYTPNSGYYGSDSFTYNATGPGGTSAPATVSVTVANPAAPTVDNASISTAYNAGGSTGLTINGVYSSTALASAAAHGTASISGATASYTPNSGYYGADSFTYTATGPGGVSAPATVSVNVGLPAAPTAGNVSLSTAYNTSGSISLSLGGVYNATALASGASHGTASISGTTASYTPNGGYYGSDSFTYTVSGPGGTSAPATVSVNVGLPAAPTAGNVSLSTAYNTSGSTPLSLGGVYNATALASGAAHGTASISGTTASYTPYGGYYGSDSFTYTVSGPGGTSAPATVSVNVGLPAAPTAGNVSLSTAYNTNGSTSLSLGGVYNATALASGAAHGTASISGTTASYTPYGGYYGSDSFTYTVSGPGGTSAPATVSVNVGVPAAPSVSGTSITTPYNTSGSGTIGVSGVYSSTAISANPSHGSASISGTTVTYTPSNGYSGADSFAITASGPGGTSAPATVSVTVQPRPVITINVTSAANLRTLANNAGYDGSTSADYTFVVPAGTTIYASAADGRGISTGSWPSGVALSLVIYGNVYGGAGTGGIGAGYYGSATAGTAGGDAIYCQAPIAITINSGGSVKGGGNGGAGGSGMVTYSRGSTTMYFGAGGGGGGFPSGIGGSGGRGANGGGDGSDGGNGTTSGGGAGGAGASSPGSTSPGSPGGGPGSSGYAIRKNGNSVSVTNNGTISGGQG